MKAVQRTYTQAVREIRELMRSIRDNLERIAKIYVEQIDSDPASAERFRRDLSDQGIPWGRLEGVGRHMVHPKVFLLQAGPQARYIEQLSAKTQERILDEVSLVPVVTDDGKVVHMDVVREVLPMPIVRRVFAGDHIRTVEEQKEYLKTQAQLVPPTARPIPYSIMRDGSVVCHVGATFSPRQTAEILRAQLRACKDMPEIERRKILEVISQ